MKTKSPKKVELLEKVVKLLEDAHIVAHFIGPLSVDYFKEMLRKEDPLVHIVSLLLATIDDVNRRSSITVPSTFRHAFSKEYLEKAKEFLEGKD